MPFDLPEIINLLKIDPALLTFREYVDVVDGNKTHPDDAYKTTLKKLNRIHSKSKFTKLLQRTKVNGIYFEIRLYAEKLNLFKRDEHGEYLRIDGAIQPYTDEELLRLGKKNPYRYTFGIFHDEMIVAAVQDEWGCLLIMVVDEYRGFGFGPLLTRIARTMEPGRSSGGFTSGGFHNFQKVHREFVRDALKSGLYRSLVQQGSMTMERVREIIDSARLKDMKPRAEKNLDSNNSSDWLLYVGDTDFIIYDRKLKDLVNDDGHLDHFGESMIKGLAFVGGDRFLKLIQFGATTPKLKTFLMSCAIENCRRANETLYLEGTEPKYVDPSMGNVAELELRKPFTHTVTPTGKPMPYDSLGKMERDFRKSFDQYDEFKNRMLEMAYAKYHGLTESRSIKVAFTKSHNAVYESVENVSVMGKPVAVFRNPSKTQLLVASARKQMRGLIDPDSGDTFWWPASAAIHVAVAKCLGIPDPLNYSGPASSRLFIKGNLMDCISGNDIIENSKSFKYLTSGNSIKIKTSFGDYSFDEWVAYRKSYEEWHSIAVARLQKNEKPISFVDWSQQQSGIRDQL